MVRTQIQLTEEQAKALKEIAAQEHVSVAEIIRRSVDVLVQKPGSCTLEEQRRRAMELSGLFHSGLPDLGSDHDRYLAEDILS